MWDILHIACLGIGVGILADGIGSIIIRGRQYHSTWFDGERVLRAAAGAALIALAIFT
jgi:ABC-type proline/glycine betaine transport system permease subunit